MEMSERDLYEVLELSKNASFSDIKKVTIDLPVCRCR